MTKSELIARLAERYPQLVAKDADFTVKTLLDAMTDALISGQRIEIRGFGSFATNSRPPRIGRNPKSGETVVVPGNGCRTSKRVRSCASGSTPWSGNRSMTTDQRIHLHKERR
jgi:integration host factor subunit beta